MPDTKQALRTHRAASGTRAARARLRFGIAPGVGWLTASLVALAPSMAQAAPLRAQVAWVRGERVYLAAEDSLSLEIGDRVTFVMRGKTVAAGVVARTFDHELAAITLSSGSLAKMRHRERLKIEFERPPVPAASWLRVGYPSARRVANCERAFFQPPLPSGSYSAIEQSDRAVRLGRDPRVSLAAPWPDTLVIRFFDDAADQEIALERGELDVAVFWPGELSRHMRDSSRWGQLVGSRGTGAADSLSLAIAVPCPVLCEPRLLPYLRQLGPDALAAALECRPAVRR